MKPITVRRVSPGYWLVIAKADDIFVASGWPTFAQAMAHHDRVLRENGRPSSAL